MTSRQKLRWVLMSSLTMRPLDDLAAGLDRRRVGDGLALQPLGLPADVQGDGAAPQRAVAHVHGGRRGDRPELDEVLAVGPGGTHEFDGFAGGGVVVVGRGARDPLGVPQGGELRAGPVHEEREAGRGGGVLGVGLGHGAPAVARDDRGGPGEFLHAVEVAAVVARGGGIAHEVAAGHGVRDQRVEQRRDALGVGVAEERLQARAPDQEVAAVVVGEQEHRAAVALGVAVLADGRVEDPVAGRQFDAGDGVRDGGGHAERVEVVARRERPAGEARRRRGDGDPLVEVAVAQHLGLRLDAPFEAAVDAGAAGAFEEPRGVPDERRDVVDGDQVAGAGQGAVGGFGGHGGVSLLQIVRTDWTAEAARRTPGGQDRRVSAAREGPVLTGRDAAPGSATAQSATRRPDAGGGCAAPPRCARARFGGSPVPPAVCRRGGGRGRGA